MPLVSLGKSRLASDLTHAHLKGGTQEVDCSCPHRLARGADPVLCALPPALSDLTIISRKEPTPPYSTASQDLPGLVQQPGHWSLQIALHPLPHGSTLRQK